MDISETIVPNSDQINAEDLLGGPRTVTITGVKAGTKDQPVFIQTAEYPDRTYRPAKSMRRILFALWGQDSSAYIGRQVTLYTDPTVKFGGQEVGGIRIAALSHIDEPKSIALTVSRGKRAPFVVQPIPTETGVHLAALTGATTLEELQAAWVAAGKAGVANMRQLIELKDARKAELATPVDPADPDYKGENA